MLLWYFYGIREGSRRCAGALRLQPPASPPPLFSPAGDARRRGRMEELQAKQKGAAVALGEAQARATQGGGGGGGGGGARKRAQGHPYQCSSPTTATRTCAHAGPAPRDG
jgi:hypothetical protein